MGNKADFRRRFAGAFFLFIAAFMLVAGETFLTARLKQHPVAALLFWMLCFIAVFLAIIIALLDMWIVRRRSLEEARGLVNETLEQIAREKKTRGKNADKQ